MRIYILSFICLISYKSTLAADKLKVTATASMFADMAKNICGGKCDTKSIVPIGGDPHIYEATPKDVKLVAESDIILVNGLNFEGWITELIENSGTKGNSYTITEGIDPIQSTQYDNTYDPHAWMDVSNGLIYIYNIYQILSKEDPENAAFYKSNYESYKAELKALEKEIKEAINAIPEAKKVLITSHDAFEYYGKAYGLKLEALMGISTDAEARASDIARVNRVISETKVPAVFIESTINPKLVKQIAEDNGVSIGGELYADSLGEPESSGGTYIGMIRHNTSVISNALSKNINASTKLDNEIKVNPLILYGGIAIILILILLFLIRAFNQ